ncbi:fimbrial protein [Enterobacter asburiae]|uniref:fimbrial protein n=1 Tax=Enterobacter asburiae TaxID=61645 RepID=UPI00403D9576
MKLNTLFIALLAGTLSMNAAEANDNVHFSGALVAEPCTLPDADTDIHIDFGSVIVKYLYQYQRTKSKPFTIHLENCDPSIMKTVSVTFAGTADDELSDMLSLDLASTAKGIAVGLEMADGSPLAINNPSQYQQLVQNKSNLNFYAYVQAKPTFISGRGLSPGEFTAFSTFTLSYQ